MKDFHSNVKAMVAIAAAAYNADQNGASIERVGYEGLEFVLAMGVGGITFTGTNKIEIIMQDSDDGSTWAAVEQKDVLGATVTGAGIVKAFTAAHAAAATYRFGYKGAGRYVRLVADFSGTHGAATPLAAVGLLFNGHVNPQADQI